MDATAGSARLMLSSLWGTVSSKASTAVTVNLQALDGRAPSAFSFIGTGATTANDANAAAYVVGTSTLDLTGVTTNSAVRFLGFVAPFASVTSGGADFNAETLVNFAATNATLLVGFGDTGITAPFTTLSSTGMSLSHAVLSASTLHTVAIGPQRIDVSTLTSGVQIVPNTTATTMQFAIGHRGSHKVNNYSNFPDFVTALNTDLNGTTTALGLAAEGSYNNTTGVLTTTQVVVALND
jgi:hypothetical protein